MCGYLNDPRLFSFSVIITFFFLPILSTLRKQQKILGCFPEDKLIQMYLDLQIQKVFTPPALNASCFLLEHQWMFEPFLIIVFESLSCPPGEKMDLKIIQSLLERVQIPKIYCKPGESAGHGGFFWRTVFSLTVQNKRGTHEQPSQNKNKVKDHSSNHAQYKETFEWGCFNNFYFFVLWTKFTHILCKRAYSGQ